MSNKTKSFSTWEDTLRFCLSEHEQGHVAEAEAGYAQLLHVQPDHVDGLRLRGLALTQLGKPDEGLPHLQRACHLAPKYALAHCHLAFALQQLNREDEAAMHLRTAADLDPSDAVSRVNLAGILIKQQQFPEAIQLAQQATVLSPNLAQAYHNLGLAYLEAGIPDQALEPLKTAVRLQPVFPDAWMHLGKAHADLARLEDAESAYQECLRQDPGHIAGAVNLANVWLRRDFVDEAIELYRQVLIYHPDNWKTQLALAAALSENDHAKEALQLLETIKCPASDNDAVLLLRVALLVELDRRLEALQEIENVSHRGMAYWSSKLRIEEASASKIEAAEQLEGLWHEQAEPSFEQKLRAAFDLGDFHHQRRDYAKASEFYWAGHNLLKQAEPYDAQEWNQSVESEFAQYAELKIHAHREAPIPVFIVGMPRSGTSLIEQILDTHSMVAAAGELTDIPRMASHIASQGIQAPQMETLLRQYNVKLRSIAPNAAYVTDKMPQNYQHLGLISALYPNAKIIFCRRDAKDNCLSIFQHRFTGNHGYSHDLEALADRYKAHETIMRRWQHTIGNPIITVQYEEMVDNASMQVNRLLEFLKLPYEEGCLNFHQNQRRCRTASREQVKQPLYNHAVGRWKYYEPYFGSLYALLDA
jgi:tetratricopeptide (TPR) repeat protein